MLSDATDDCSAIDTVVDFELQQFLHFRHSLAFEHTSHADIELFEIVESDSRLNRSSLEVGSFVGFLDVGQTLHLSIDGAVLDFFEEELWRLELMPYSEQVGASQTVPFNLLNVEHSAQFSAAERQERLESNREVCYELQRQVEDSANASHVGLGEFPRFGIGKVFVANSSQVHHLFLSIAETEVFEQILHLGLHLGKFAESLSVVVG